MVGLNKSIFLDRDRVIVKSKKIWGKPFAVNKYKEFELDNNAKKGINSAIIKAYDLNINIPFTPFITVSVGMPGDHHVRKAVITDEDWHILRDHVQYDFLQDGHFAELKESEMLMERLRVADSMRDYVGKYFSVEYVRKQVLRQTEREISDIDKQIKKEIDDGIIAMPDAGEYTREIK